MWVSVLDWCCFTVRAFVFIAPHWQCVTFLFFIQHNYCFLFVVLVSLRESGKPDHIVIISYGLFVFRFTLDYFFPYFKWNHFCSTKLVLALWNILMWQVDKPNKAHTSCSFPCHNLVSLMCTWRNVEYQEKTFRRSHFHCQWIHECEKNSQNVVFAFKIFFSRAIHSQGVLWAVINLISTFDFDEWFKLDQTPDLQSMRKRNRKPHQMVSLHV